MFLIGILLGVVGSSSISAGQASFMITTLQGDQFGRKLFITGRAEPLDQSSYQDLLLSTANFQTSQFTLVGMYGPGGSIFLPTIEGNEVEIDLVPEPSALNAPNFIYTTFSGIVSVHMGSQFVSLYPNFFTSPIQDQENQKRLILTTGIPINNPHTYIETISPNSWSVYMIARLSTQEPLESIQPLSNNILEKIAYIHTIYDYEMLPYNEFIVPFIEAVQAAGAGTFIPDYSKNIEFNNCDSIERFPEIIYSFYQRESNQLAKRVVDIRLYPSDYAMAIPGPERKCLTFLRSHRLTNGVTSSSIIGANLLHTISVHFDSENRRIGFADPPNE